MYIIYKDSAIIGSCYTKKGAKRACRHYINTRFLETGESLCRMEYHKIDDYWTMKVGYCILRAVRAIEEHKLRRLRSEERMAITERVAQSRKVASLY